MFSVSSTIDYHLKKLFTIEVKVEKILKTN